MALALTPLRSTFRGEPRKRDVVNILQTSRNELNQYETSQATTRPAITQQGHPPPRIRQFIKGMSTAVHSTPLQNVLFRLEYLLSLQFSSEKLLSNMTYPYGGVIHVDASTFGALPDASTSFDWRGVGILFNPSQKKTFLNSNLATLVLLS